MGAAIMASTHDRADEVNKGLGKAWQIPARTTETPLNGANHLGRALGS